MKTRGFAVFAVLFFAALRAQAADVNCDTNKGNIVAPGVEDHTLTCFDYGNGRKDIYISEQVGVNDGYYPSGNYYDLTGGFVLSGCTVTATPTPKASVKYYKFSCTDKDSVGIAEILKMKYANWKRGISKVSSTKPLQTLIDATVPVVPQVVNSAAGGEQKVVAPVK